MLPIIEADKISVMLPITISPTNGSTFDYRILKGLKLSLGDFVNVPFGSRSVIGVVWGKNSGYCSEDKLKNISFKLDCPPMPEVSRQFVDWVARYTVSSPGAVLKMVMSVPDALKPPKIINAYKINNTLDDLNITPARKRVLETLKLSSPKLSADIIREAGVSPSVVKGLIRLEYLIPVEIEPEVIKSTFNSKSGEFWA